MAPLFSARHLPALSLTNPGNKMRMGIKPVTDTGPFPLKRRAVQQAGYVRFPDAPDRIGDIALSAQGIEFEDKKHRLQQRPRRIIFVAQCDTKRTNPVGISQEYLGTDLAAVVPDCDIDRDTTRQNRAYRDEF